MYNLDDLSTITLCQHRVAVFTFQFNNHRLCVSVDFVFFLNNRFAFEFFAVTGFS